MAPLLLSRLLTCAYTNEQNAERLSDVFFVRLGLETAMIGFDTFMIGELTKNERDQVYRWTLEAVERILTDQHWTTPGAFDGVRLAVWKRSDSGEMVVEYCGANRNWRPGFWWLLTQLLASSGDRLRRCHGCPRIFVRSGRSDFCSPRCNQRFRSKKHYQKNIEQIRADRKAQYDRAKFPARVTHRNSLQQIATKSSTGGNKKAQPKHGGTKNPPVPTRGNRRA
jgi:hypothetical protein